MIRILIAGSLLLASIYAAHAFGLGLGDRFGRLGTASKRGTGAPPPPGCMGTGLDFTIPCNSQYITIL